MIMIVLLVVVLLITGISAILDFDWSKIWNQIKLEAGKTTLSDDLMILSGTTPKGFFSRQNYETSLLLRATGREHIYYLIRIVSLILLVFGVMISLLAGNPFLAPVLGITFWLLPKFYIASTAALHKKRMATELETAISLITSSYKSTENIIQSVRFCIDSINPPVKAYFELFLAETDSIDPVIVSALNRLKMRVPNAIFHDWINTLIQCQSDRTMIRCLDDAIDRFSEMRKVQADMMAEITTAKTTAYIMALICIACIPGFYFLNTEWYNALVYTIPGKFAVAIAFCIVLFSLWRVHKLTGPIEYKGEV